MKAIDKLFSRLGYTKRLPGAGKRSFEAAAVNRLTMDWSTTPFSADWDLRYSLRQLRARSRELASNNGYARKFLKMCVTNIAGPNGIQLRPMLKDRTGRPNKQDNQEISDAWGRWGKKENCTVTGLLSWPAFQRQVIETVARDGEIFIRKYRGFQNDFGFALQALEAEYVDVNLNRPGDNIRMGIEYDDFRRPTAYWILASNIFDYQPPMHALKYIRVPASDMIHIYWQERPEQGRGIPWMSSAMLEGWNLKEYKINEIVASRVAAAKMGFLEPGTGAEDAYTGDDKDDLGNTVSQVEPGAIETLPRGWKFSSFDPQHPSTQFDSFVKSCLRGMSSGWLVSYNGLANDLEKVNFSSIRQGVIDERDTWRILQSMFVDDLCQPVYEDWLPMAALSGNITVHLNKVDRDAVKWKPRRWDWVDPLKDQQATMVAINTGMNSRTNLLSEQSDEDFEELMDEIAHERDVIKQKGLVFDVTANPSASKMGSDPNPKVPGATEPVNAQSKNGGATA